MRRFQFSLWTAFIAMILASVGLGGYLRFNNRPKRILEELEQTGTPQDWVLLKAALLENSKFCKKVNGGARVSIILPTTLEGSYFSIRFMKGDWTNLFVEQGIVTLNDEFPESVADGEINISFPPR